MATRPSKWVFTPFGRLQLMDNNLKQKTKTGLYWSFFNQFSFYGVQFFIGIVLARLLSPADYGTIAMPAVFLAVAQCLVDSGFGTALVRKEKVSEEDLSTAFIFSLIVGAACYLLLFFSSSWIAEFYNTPILEELLKFSALATLFGPIASVQQVQLTRKIDFKAPAIISLICQFFTGGVGIIMAFSGYGVWSLVIPGVGASVLRIILLYYFVRWLPHTGWSRESFRYLWGFGNKLLASALLDTIYNNIYPIIIGKFYSARDLGLYTRAQAYALLPSQNVTSVIQRVTFPVLSKMQNEDEVLAINYRRMLRATAFVVFPIMLILSALASPFILVLVTEKWSACIVLLQIVCFSLMWYPIHAINLNLLQVKGRSDLFLRLEIIKKIIGVSIMVITVPHGLVAMCCGNVVSSILCLVVNTHYTGKMINIGFFKQMKDLSHILALSLCVFFALTFFCQVVTNIYAQLFLGGLLGIAIYVGISILFHFSELEDIKYMLKRK